MSWFFFFGGKRNWDEYTTSFQHQIDSLWPTSGLLVVVSLGGEGSRRGSIKEVFLDKEKRAAFAYETMLTVRMEVYCRSP